MKHLKTTLLAFTLAATGSLLWAQNAPAPATAAGSASTSTYVAPPWIYKTQNLNKAQVDALLADPKKLVIIDLRRPDELVKYGSFQTYLNVQLKDLKEQAQLLDFIPKDRTILTVSNRAHRAGDAGDFLTSKGYKVAGATGSEDYREAGGTIYKVSPPAPTTAKAQ